MFTRSNLRIGVAGDITASELAPLLDRIFSELPAGAAFEPPSALRPQTSNAELVRMDLSQTLVMFGNQVPRLSWRQGLAFDVANQVLSGSFTGRLFREVREKRGLVYTIATARYDVADLSVFFGSFGAGGDNAAPALEVTRSEIARFAAEGPTEEEVRAAKDTFLGGYLLGLDTNDNLATTLIGMQRQNMPITLLSDFESEVERLTREDVHAAVKQLIRPDLMATIAVGNPPEEFKVEGLARRSE